jgi:hypothetical protein
MILKVSVSIEKGNELAKAGTLASTIRRCLEAVKPEAAYFAEFDGQRTGILVVNVESASDIPRVAEPFFLALNARVEVHPCMKPEDLAAAGPHIEAAAKNFG